MVCTSMELRNAKTAKHFERERARTERELGPRRPIRLCGQALSRKIFPPLPSTHPSSIIRCLFGLSPCLRLPYLTYPVLLVHQMYFIYRYPTFNFLSRNKYHIHHEIPLFLPCLFFPPCAGLDVVRPGAEVRFVSMNRKTNNEQSTN